MTTASRPSSDKASKYHHSNAFELSFGCHTSAAMLDENENFSFVISWFAVAIFCILGTFLGLNAKSIAENKKYGKLLTVK